jgi:hypothetical protein
VWAAERLQELYGFIPSAIRAVYSNQGLSWWEGAACWIDEEKHSYIQLRQGFRTGKYLGLYSRDEALAHEAVHAARAAFNEPESEEFFAWATSPSLWRRATGPLFRSSWESSAFLGFALFSFLFLWGLLPLAGLVATGAIRLLLFHRRLRRAAIQLRRTIVDPDAVRAVLFRLTDQEIRSLSRGQLQLGDASLRWRLIRQAYKVNLEVEEEDPNGKENYSAGRRVERKK